MKKRRKVAAAIAAASVLLGLQAEETLLEKVQVNSTSYKLDELSRNSVFIDSGMIEEKAYSSTEQVFKSLPFATFSNFGLGQNIDLRGQGRSANVNTQVFLNGIGLNMLDSSHGVTPLNSISVNEIESIEILPGGGAVMYGSGTRGGVVNITTKKRYEKLSANLGVGYGYADGSNAKIDTKIGGKIGEGLYLSFGGNYLFSQGYRDQDLGHLGSVNGNLTWDFHSKHSISLDVNYFKSSERSTPVLRFSEISHPSKNDRRRAGNGKILSLQDRISAALNYEYRVDEAHKLSVRSYFHHYDLGYKENLQVLDYDYVMGSMVLHLLNTKVNQGGSSFLDSRAGLQIRYDYKHKNGLLITGFDSVYSQGKRKLNLNIDWKGQVNVARMNITSYDHFMRTYVDAKKWSNSLYAIEKYDFNSSFSLTGGGRYEFSWYGGYRTLDNQMKLGMTSLAHSSTPSTSIPPAPPAPQSSSYQTMPPSAYALYKPISHLTHNFALEFSPRYDFSVGNLYAKYERGFRSPNPDNLTSRSGSGRNNNYLDTGVKSETYDTFELGSKLFAGEHAMFLLTGFYTLTHNEIYTLGSAHTGNGFKVGNYKRTHRAGVELASEQSFLEGMIGLNESFSYVDARIVDSGIKEIRNGSLIPYVSNYKATLGVNYRFHKRWNLWLSSSFVGAQRDTAENIIPAYNLTDIGMDFSYKDFSLSFGVRNVADSFYYSFYNKDARDEITGYAFLIAEGRSYFLEGRYKF